ncbi:maker778, partial [Drosophila busckii]
MQQVLKVCFILFLFLNMSMSAYLNLDYDRPIDFNGKCVFRAGYWIYQSNDKSCEYLSAPTKEV